MILDSLLAGMMLFSSFAIRTPNVQPNPDDKQLFIDPEECIDCGACEPECPVEAIFEETEVPEEWNKYIKMNYEFFGQEAP